MAARRISALLISTLALLALAAAALLPMGSVGAEECGASQHPSGKDRCEEKGGSSPQGNAQSDPDDDTRGPQRSNGGEDQEGADNPSTRSNAADRDSNNGCGNDQDFEDDNEGLCTEQSRDGAAAQRDAVRERRSLQRQERGRGERQSKAKVNSSRNEAALGQSAGVAGLGFAAMPVPDLSADAGTLSSDASAAGAGEAIAAGATAPAELPATGANVGAQLLAGLSSLALGGAALRRGSRPARPEPWLRA